MALIQCPVCKKRISNKSSTCSGCGAPIGHQDEEAIARAEKNIRYQRNRKLQNYAFLSLSIFLIGVFLFWGHRDNVHHWLYYLGVFLLSTGFLGYSIIRIYKIIKK